eukprot:scaffold36512_cov59-Attheya_sp.AAC.4
MILRDHMIHDEARHGYQHSRIDSVFARRDDVDAEHGVCGQVILKTDNVPASHHEIEGQSELYLILEISSDLIARMYEEEKRPILYYSPKYISLPTGGAISIPVEPYLDIIVISLVSLIRFTIKICRLLCRSSRVREA